MRPKYIMHEYIMQYIYVVWRVEVPSIMAWYICVLILLYMCPQTTIYVSSYYYMCVLVLCILYY
jgi:hypothetical protein